MVKSGSAISNVLRLDRRRGCVVEALQKGLESIHTGTILKQIETLACGMAGPMAEMGGGGKPVAESRLLFSFSPCGRRQAAPYLGNSTTISATSRTCRGPGLRSAKARKLKAPSLGLVAGPRSPVMTKTRLPPAVLNNSPQLKLAR
jgi:hypothetical protein